MPTLKARISDESGTRRALMRISHEITENNKGIDGVVVVGIVRRGVNLGNIICDNLEKIEGSRPALYELDVTSFRDDVEDTRKQMSHKKTNCDMDINGKKVIIVDDVIYTGRTARAALEAVFSFGRPSKIQLAVLVDRGHRELPIRADYVGKTIPTSKNEIVKVSTPEYDGTLGVDLFE
ncbi:MAG: bifunctional pyr operon transcriptional regulator/uracil phosphoribosyltransferase PyrR [Clostridia bacterium]|nr:bifunctional pyr operon transcriptional regulator/uracil phosphoribosyltransferase PyrR [Clostridia bacterium]